MTFSFHPPAAGLPGRVAARWSRSRDDCTRDSVGPGGNRGRHARGGVVRERVPLPPDPPARRGDAPSRQPPRTTGRRPSVTARARRPRQHRRHRRAPAAMNIFRLAGDLLHVASIFILLLKITTSRSCSGISRRTQELYLVVFATRYVDLLVTHPLRSALMFYNTVMKILFLTSSAYIVYLIRVKYKHTYDHVHDTFRHEYAIGGAAVAALIFHLKLTVLELLWAFSVFLEAVAILPQLVLLQKTGEVENM
jgi:hypothetical protein